MPLLKCDTFIYIFMRIDRWLRIIAAINTTTLNGYLDLELFLAGRQRNTGFLLSARTRRSQWANLNKSNQHCSRFHRFPASTCVYRHDDVTVQKSSYSAKGGFCFPVVLKPASIMAMRVRNSTERMLAWEKGWRLVNRWLTKTISQLSKTWFGNCAWWLWRS